MLTLACAVSKVSTTGRWSTEAASTSGVPSLSLVASFCSPLQESAPYLIIPPDDKLRGEQ